jgi:hypothetical protein
MGQGNFYFASANILIGAVWFTELTDALIGGI